MAKRNIVFFLVDLGLGGIEKSFLNLVDNLDFNKVNVTVVLAKKRGIFLNKLSPKVKVIDYNLSECKITILRKIINFFKLIKNKIKYHHQFDIAINYTGYYALFSNLALSFGHESIIWVHNKVSTNTNITKFLKMNKYLKFKKIVFVSQEALEDYQAIVKPSKQELIVCRNIIVKSKAPKQKPTHHDKFIFLNVSRHFEPQKKLSIIIEATAQLAKKRNDFEVWLIGEGPDTPKYKELIKSLNVAKYVKMLGVKADPMPYYYQCDVVLMSSEYEGFPVVFCECVNAQKHLITTNVADAKIVFDDTQATIASQFVNSYAQTMEKVMNFPKKVNKFNIVNFNDKIKKIYALLFY